MSTVGLCRWCGQPLDPRDVMPVDGGETHFDAAICQVLLLRNIARRLAKVPMGWVGPNGMVLVGVDREGNPVWAPPEKTVMK